MSTIQILLLTIIVMLAYANAKPVGNDDTTRKIVKHHDGAFGHHPQMVVKHHSRRHADNAIIAILAKEIRQGKRINALIRFLRRGNPITMQIQPRPEDVPDRKETALQLLSRINEGADDIRVRHVMQQDVSGLSRLEQFTRRADALRQTAVMAKTCLELQQTILKMESIRIKVRCRSDPPVRTSQYNANVATVAGGFRQATPSHSRRINPIDYQRANDQINYRRRRS